MRFKLFRILSIILSFFLLTGFVPILSFVGPGITALSSGNIYKASAQFIVNQRIEKETGKNSLALIKELNLSIHKVIKYFKKLEPTEGRGKIHNIKRYTKKFKLIDESYNANPLSVRNAIKKFDSIKKQNFKKYLILLLKAE